MDKITDAFLIEITQENDVKIIKAERSNTTTKFYSPPYLPTFHSKREDKNVFGTPPEVDDKNELVPDRILFKKRGEYQMGGVFVKHQVSLKNKKTQKF